MVGETAGVCAGPDPAVEREGHLDRIVGGVLKVDRELALIVREFERHDGIALVIPAGADRSVSFVELIIARLGHSRSGERTKGTGQEN